jgi:hypothetical protein
MMTLRTDVCLAWLFSILAVSAIVRSAEPQPLDHALARIDETGATSWFDCQLLRIEGQGWSETESDYDRLPASAVNKVREAVWNLSRHSAGITVQFVTDATTLHARWTLTSSRLAMPHMAATGVSGLDLYVQGDDGRWNWLACGQPTKQTNQVRLVRGIPEGRRAYLLYLPLYNGVTSVEVGIPRDRMLATRSPRPTHRAKPIIFYGTSITHGACASRPGMTHPAILGRRFDRPVINLGFSGNGRMEPEVARLMAELDAAVYVIDCLPNISAQDVLDRTKTCVDILRASHPETPILLVEDRSYSDAFLVAAKRDRNKSSRAALRKVYDEMKAAGVSHLLYLEGDRLLGDDNEGTVDSSHPTDLGFMRQAEAFAKVLDPILD